VRDIGAERSAGIPWLAYAVEGAARTAGVAEPIPEGFAASGSEIVGSIGLDAVAGSSGP